MKGWGTFSTFIVFQEHRAQGKFNIVKGKTFGIQSHLIGDILAGCCWVTQNFSVALNAHCAEHPLVEIWRELSCPQWVRSEAWKRAGKGHENKIAHSWHISNSFLSPGLADHTQPH